MIDRNIVCGWDEQLRRTTTKVIGLPADTSEIIGDLIALRCAMRDAAGVKDSLCDEWESEAKP